MGGLESLNRSTQLYRSTQLSWAGYSTQQSWTELGGGIFVFLLTYWVPRLISNRLCDPFASSMVRNVRQLYEKSYEFCPSAVRFLTITLTDNVPVAILFLWGCGTNPQDYFKLKTILIIILSSKIFEILRTCFASVLHKINRIAADLVGPRDFYYKIVERGGSKEAWDFNVLSAITPFNFNKSTENNYLCWTYGRSFDLVSLI